MELLVTAANTAVPQPLTSCDATVVRTCVRTYVNSLENLGTPESYVSHRTILDPLSYQGMQVSRTKVCVCMGAGGGYILSLCLDNAAKVMVFNYNIIILKVNMLRILCSARMCN